MLIAEKHTFCEFFSIAKRPQILLNLFFSGKLKFFDWQVVEKVNFDPCCVVQTAKILPALYVDFGLPPSFLYVNLREISSLQSVKTIII